MKNIKIFTCSSIIAAIIFVSGCTETRTSEGPEAYRLWAGEPLPENVQILNGQFWKSPHFTYEYQVYLELKVASDWVDSFILQNKLSPLTEFPDLPRKCPVWFNPPERSKKFTLPQNGPDGFYFYDTASQHFFIYEMQL